MEKITLPRYRMGLSVEQMDKLYLEDIETQKRRQPYHLNDLRRRLAKAKSFPMPYLVKEKHGAEEYRAYSRIESKNQPFKAGIDFDSVVLFKNSRGTCMYMNLDPFKILEQRDNYINDGLHCSSHRYLFTPHFFERYEMRNGWDGHYSDIYNQFIFNNLASDGAAFYTQMCEARPDDYKTVDVWSLCNDGLMLGEVKREEDFNAGKPYIIQINTFLDLETLTKRQDKYSHILKSMKAFFEMFPIKESKDELKKRTFVTVVKDF